MGLPLFCLIGGICIGIPVGMVLFWIVVMLMAGRCSQDERQRGVLS